MLRRVARRGQHPKGEAAEVDLVAVAHGRVRRRQVRGARRQDRGAGQVREFTTAGHEVGVQMRLGHDSDPKPAPLRRRERGPRIASGIDHQSSSVAQIHQPAGVAQPLVADAHDIDHDATYSRACFNMWNVTALTGMFK